MTFKEFYIFNKNGKSNCVLRSLFMILIKNMIKDLKFDDNSYIVFCWDKNNYYHMVPIIDNVIYDKKL